MITTYNRIDVNTVVSRPRIEVFYSVYDIILAAAFELLDFDSYIPLTENASGCHLTLAEVED